MAKKKLQAVETTEQSASVESVPGPIYKAVSVVRIPNTNDYAAVTFHIQDGVVIKTEAAAEANLYGIASMDAKVLFSNLFLYGPQDN